MVTGALESEATSKSGVRAARPVFSPPNRLDRPESARRGLHPPADAPASWDS